MTAATPEMLRRIDAAIDSAGVSRAEVYLELPECHKNKCQARHPDGTAALGLMKRQISASIHSELLYRTTTRPDLGVNAEPDAAAITLAHLLRTYNVHDTGTYIRAAELLIEAYPAIGDALTTPEPPQETP
ncbi:hypothetical protein [Curtobacterium sp. MCBA15_004]|uniref:hypothetical protein n=1 Tax=Curtobacterium sp. MCBA15_004 TaxID=1898733 RepID=UPI0008DCCE5D|nr:hypothetical protein [Curtobacterium sp. MCBA15_004]WIA96427.1 hypothetical protein QOL16_15215 [Curtobacterium sp. MCBA15_004]